MVGAMADDLIKLIRSRELVVERVYISGGGNEAGDCRRMTLEWIKSWVTNLIAGRPDQSLDDAGVWEELRI